MPDNEIQKNSLAGRAVWLLAAKSIAYLFSFALPLVLVRYLSQAEFGLYKQAFLVVNTGVAWLPMGFMMSAYYFLPRETPAGQKAIITNILFFYYGLGVLVWGLLALVPQVLTAWVGNADLLPYASLVGLAVLFWVGSSFLEVIALAHQETRLATVFIVNAQLTKTLLLLLATLVFGSVRALLVAAIVQGALQMLVLQWYLRSRFGAYWRHHDFALLRRQLSYALPLGGAGILYYVFLDLHNYFVSHYFSAADFAVYSLGSFTLPLVGLIYTAVSAVLIPHISHLQTQAAQAREILTLQVRAMRKLALLYFPIYAFFLVLGREVIEFMFGARYLGAWPVLLVNITLIPFLALIGDPILRAYPAQRFFMLKARLFLLGPLCLALWWGTTRAGLLGTAAAAIFFMIIDRMVEAGRAWIVAGGTWRDLPRLRVGVRIAMAATAAGAATAAVHAALGDVKPLYHLAIGGGALAVVYGLVLIVSGALEPGEKELLRSYWHGLLNGSVALGTKKPRSSVASWWKPQA